MSGRVDPFAARVEVRERLHGTDDGISRGERVGGVVDDVAESAAAVTVALDEEAGGVGVAIDDAAAGFVFFGERADVLPIEEALVDFVVKIAIADAAMGLVKLKAGEEPGALGRGETLRGLCGAARVRFRGARDGFFGGWRISRGVPSRIRRGRREVDYG